MSYYAIAGFLVLIIITLSLIDNKLAVYFAIIWSIFGGALIYEFHILPKLSKGIDDVVIVGVAFILFTFILFTIEKRRRRLVRNYRFKELLPIALFIIWGLFSALANEVAFYKALYGLRFIFLGPLLYYIIVVGNFRENSLKQIVKFLYSIIYIQTAAVLAVAFYSIYNGTYNPDLPRGLVGEGTNFGGYLIALLFIFHLYDYFYGRKKKLRNLFKLFIPLVAIFLMGSRSCIVGLIFTSIILVILKDYNLRSKYVARKAIEFGTIAILFLIILSGFYSTFIGGRSLAKRYNMIAQVRSEMSIQTGSSRLAHIPYALGLLKDYSPSIFIGTGPSTYDSAGGWFFHAPLTQKATQEFLPYILRREKGVGISVSTQFTTICVEYGIIGLILCEVIFLGFLVKVSNLQKQIHNRYWHRLALVTKHFLLLYIFGQVVGTIFEAQFVSYPLWILLGILARYSILCKSRFQLNTANKARKSYG